MTGFDLQPDDAHTRERGLYPVIVGDFPIGPEWVETRDTFYSEAH